MTAAWVRNVCAYLGVVGWVVCFWDEGCVAVGYWGAWELSYRRILAWPRCKAVVCTEHSIRVECLFQAVFSA